MTDRALATQMWMFGDYWGVKTSRESTPEEQLDYGRALLMAANGDGTLTEDERQWILGYLTTGGHPDELISTLEQFDGDVPFEDLFVNGVQAHASRMVIFDAIRASGSDGELAEGEVSAIRGMAAKLGVTPEEVDGFLAIYEEELALRTRRLQAIFPEMFPADLLTKV